MSPTLQLADKYQPRHICDFVGLPDIKKTLTGFVANPYPSNWLFSGAPGLGKTSMAIALSNDLPADDMPEDKISEMVWGGRLRHYYSNDVNLATVADIKDRFNFVFSQHGCWTVYLIDEVDEITKPAHIAFLGVMENLAARVITVFTCNSTHKLPERLMQRCHHLEFSNYGMAPDLIRHLADIWAHEASPEATPPNFARLVKDCHNSVRKCLMELDPLLRPPKT
jgi:DNA polymerase III gamma/tau subunit